MIQITVGELTEADRSDWKTQIRAVWAITSRIKIYIDLGYAIETEMNDHPWDKWPVKWWINFEDEGEAILFKLKYL